MHPSNLPRVSIVPFLVNQNLYYRILTTKLVNQKKELQWRLLVLCRYNWSPRVDIQNDTKSEEAAVTNGDIEECQEDGS